MRRRGFVRLTEAQIDAVFEAATSQTEYLIGLYRLVFPDWDDIDQVDRWPACNDQLWTLICRKAMAWDRQHVPHVLGGGAWMNHGFSSDDALADGLVSLKRCKITYKREGVAS